uniref:FeS assembly protein SufD iron-regulated ABC transporter membrane-spanning permease n=1 Tax=Candidatus Endecteinascidia fromenterensis TaxID=266021 RepID=G8D477_9GAMM|nr:FeS assembly protein SufD iron-regulated ABC transporter membrane-spanning permease [Candidatus Endoecteinascidia frumentensis]
MKIPCLFISPKFPQTDQDIVANFQKKCWTSFYKKGFSLQDKEYWKYSNFNQLLSNSRPYADIFNKKQKNLNFYNKKKQNRIKKNHLYFFNGKFDHLQSNVSDGIKIQRFNEWKKQNPYKTISLLSNVDHKIYPMAEANASMINDGIVLTVLKDKWIREPLYILYIWEESKYAQHYRHYIILEENAKLVLIEKNENLKKNKNLYLNTVMHIILNKYSRLEHIQEYYNIKDIIWLNYSEVSQKSQSEYYYFSIVKKNFFSRSDIKINLEGEYAKCWVNGIYDINNKMYYNIYIHINHICNSTYSNIFLKGILRKNANFVFYGKSVALKNTKNIQIFQKNENFVMDNQVCAYSHPVLEIYTDNIQCKHAVTFGKLDINAIFYLRNKGINKEQAISLLEKAFLYKGISYLSKYLRLIILRIIH